MATFSTHGDVHAVHESEGIEGVQRARLPFLHGFHDVIRDVGNLLGRELESIDFVDGLGDVTLAHAAPVHGDDLVLDFGDVALVLRDDLRLERAVAVAGNFDFSLALRGLDGLLRIAVAGVALGLRRTLVMVVAEVVFKLALERSFDHRAKDFLQTFGDVSDGLRLEGRVDLLSQLLFRGEFAFCHCVHPLRLRVILSVCQNRR